MTYKDAIPKIAEIYSEKGYVTERDISLVLIKMNVPMKEIDDLLDVLNKFSLDIRESDTVAVPTEQPQFDKTPTYSKINSETQQASYVSSTGYLQDLLFFSSTSCYGTGRMLSKTEFILYAGARVSETCSDSARSSTVKNRARYRGIVENNVTTENIIFSSSSAAGCFICGYSVNGKIVWKNEMGITLKQLLGEV